MPEALVILLVLIFSVALYVAARIQARDPSIWNPRQEVRRLRNQQSRLEQRLELADLEDWDHEMRGRLIEQLRSTRFELAHMVAEMDEPV